VSDDDGFLLKTDVETAVCLLMSVVSVASLSAVVAFTDQWAGLVVPLFGSGAMFVWFLDSVLRQRWP
jgi:hypothetical protein